MARLLLYDMYETLNYPRLEEIGHYRSIGYKEENLAHLCGISLSSWKQIKKKDYAEELREVLKQSKAKLLMKIEKTLFEKALAGDKTCIIFALKNLAPERWRDVHQVENTTDVRVVNDLSGGVLDTTVKKGPGRPKKVPTADFDPNSAFDVKMVN